MLQVQQFEESLPRILELPKWQQLESFNYSCTQQGEQTFQIPQLSLSTINFQGYYMDASRMQNWEMTPKNKESLKQSQIIIQKCGTCPWTLSNPSWIRKVWEAEKCHSASSGWLEVLMPEKNKLLNILDQRLLSEKKIVSIRPSQYSKFVEEDTVYWNQKEMAPRHM